MNVHTISVAILCAACYAPARPSVVPHATRTPPAVNIPDPAQDVDLDQLRTQWSSFATTAGWTRPRNTETGPQTSVSITGFRGISSIAPDAPPPAPVLFAKMVNRGKGLEKRYRLKPSSVAEYYVIVDGFNFGGATLESRWRILEVPTNAQSGRVDFVKMNGKVLAGKVTHCVGHSPKLFEETDFWNCSDGDIDHHASVFSKQNALAALTPGILDGEFIARVFKSVSVSPRVNGGDETAWASCSGGCCTLVEY